jgi:hypothetical protein
MPQAHQLQMAPQAIHGERGGPVPVRVRIRAGTRTNCAGLSPRYAVAWVSSLKQPVLREMPRPKTTVS